MNETMLGKISEVKFGKLDGRIGLWLTLSGSWCVTANIVCWDPEDIIPDGNHKWKEEDRDKQLVEIMRKVSKLLKQAKVDNINDLLNVPVEFTSKGGLLDSWRILEEVL